MNLQPYVVLGFKYRNTKDPKVLVEFERVATNHIMRIGLFNDDDVAFISLRINAWKEKLPELSEALARAFDQGHKGKFKDAFVRKHVPLIQRTWRRAISNPSYSLCRMRLMREAFELVLHLDQ